jgi:decaprenylphospho-beta-D-erythro-pentofuranosid-2-ulose 2-reductase
MRDGTGNVESVLVLGGGSEIGEAIVRRLTEGRTRLVVLAGRPGRRDEVAARLREAGVPDVTVVDWDATDVEGHAVSFERVWDAHGDIDLVLIAAGVLGDEDIAQRDGRAAAEVLEQNFTGPAAALVEAGNRMRAQGHGTIVVLSSAGGVRVRRANLVYGASKAGLDAFAQAFGDELADDAVSVVVVRPGFDHTRMTAGRPPAPLATTPEVVADAVVSGLRRGATTVYAPPAVRWLVAGVRILPRSLLRRLPA